MKLLTKVETSLPSPASQLVPMPPAVDGTGNPKKLNHSKSKLRERQHDDAPQDPFCETAPDLMT